ncbi:leucine-rich repeat and IQ domain-containing protein 3 [Salvelinus fontinalis]|uniref:leucine-rich repeat and IQ domain-containing protein 3 n=1 Tax=Salvelinus fontinalis TaxID=8038 RepID=UPI0024856F24|nr:leucine-rich repeat and IQ domain-containing protein 3 [Salvelinus fontinalis]
MDSLDAQRKYLVTCSESLILSHGQGPGLDLVEKETDPQQVVMVNLSCLLLKNLDNVGSCRSLRVCILADNFISTIDALITCVHIVKLDLKGNQITQLPGVVFWDSLRRLQLLHLHDNNMGTRKNIEGLSGCPNLTALTLYDTPLSLKGNYRHCIINSIWSLKALDNFVVSDEEIIENWILPLHFKTLCRNFYLNLYPAAKGPYQREMRAIHKIISEVNRIQSVYSPTLIIQRWIRGHLTRKRLGLVPAVPSRERFSIRVHLSPIASVETDSQQTQEETWVKECTAKQHLQVLQEVVTSQASLEAKKQKDISPPHNTTQNSKTMRSNRAKYSEAEREFTAAEEFYEEKLGKMCFRLIGFKALVHQVEPVSNMLISRQQGGRDIRSAIRLFHTQRPEPPKLPHPRPPLINAEKRLMGRCLGSISLAPFQVIQRAYRMREQAEALQRRAQQVAHSQARREGAQGQRHGLLEARREVVLQVREKEQKEVEGALALLRASRDREVQEVRQKHAVFLEVKRRRASERAMVIAFSRQHAFLSKTVNRHAVRQRQSHAQQERSVMVASSRQQSRIQRERIKGCIEDRQQSLKEEAITSRVNRDTYLATKHTNQLLRAQERVASVKASHAKMEVLHPVPVNQTA